jgi:hypothetical protein
MHLRKYQNGGKEDSLSDCHELTQRGFAALSRNQKSHGNEWVRKYSGILYRFALEVSKIRKGCHYEADGIVPRQNHGCNTRFGQNSFSRDAAIVGESKWVEKVHELHQRFAEGFFRLGAGDDGHDKAKLPGEGR